MAPGRGPRRAPRGGAAGSRGARRAPREGSARRWVALAVAVVALVAGVWWWFGVREAPAVRLFHQGRDLQARGDNAAAISRYQEALAANPSRVEVRYFLGQLLLADRRAVDAIPHLNAAVEAGVRDDAAPFDLARALASTGDGPAAQRALARLTVPPQADTASFAVAGQLAEELGDAPLAVRFYSQAAERADVPVQVMERLGVLLAATGRPRDAVAVLERALTRTPGHASLHLNLAVALTQDGQMAKARASVAEALRLRPDYPQAKALAERLGR